MKTVHKLKEYFAVGLLILLLILPLCLAGLYPHFFALIGGLTVSGFILHCAGKLK